MSVDDNETLLGVSPGGAIDTEADDATVNVDNLPPDEGNTVEEIDFDQSIEEIVPEDSDSDLEDEEGDNA